MDDSMEDKTLDLIISGLLTDGGHHKQWFLEQLLIKLGYKIWVYPVKPNDLSLGYKCSFSNFLLTI